MIQVNFRSRIFYPNPTPSVRRNPTPTPPINRRLLATPTPTPQPCQKAKSVCSFMLQAGMQQDIQTPWSCAQEWWKAQQRSS